MPEALKAQRIGTLEDGRQLVRMLCEAEPVEHDGAQWIHVMPFGPFVEARDGRTFQVSDAVGVAAQSELPLLVDWEHQSESYFGSTRAAGWVEEVYVENGQTNRFPRPGVWGKASWTPEGEKDVKDKAFRFLSPVLLMDSETRDVERIVSVALTNRPALHLQGLDSYRQRFTAQFGRMQQEERGMKKETVLALCALLGLAPEAEDGAILDAVKAKTAGAASSTADKEMCAQLTKQLSDAQTENQQLKQRLDAADKAAFAAEVKDTLDKASQEGRVPPAARKGFEEICLRGREHFESFKQNVLPNLPVIGERAAPSVAKGAESGETFGLERSVYDALRASGKTDEEIKAAVEHNRRVKAKQIDADEED